MYQAVKGKPSDRTRRMLSQVSGFTRDVGDQIGELQQSAGLLDILLRARGNAC
jgi:hypothetical protein